MKNLGLEVYVAAAYGGLTGKYIRFTITANDYMQILAGIFNGKSRVKAMRSFRGVSAAILKRFLSTGLKTFEQIEQYLNTARLHPLLSTG